MRPRTACMMPCLDCPENGYTCSENCAKSRIRQRRGAVARWMRALVVAQPRRATPGSARPLDRHSGRMGPPERRSVPRSSSRGCWAGAHRAHHASVVEAAGRLWAYAAPKPVPSRRLQRRRCDCRRAGGCSGMSLTGKSQNDERPHGQNLAKSGRCTQPRVPPAAQ